MGTPQKSKIATKNGIYIKGSYLFQTIMLGIHVSFRGCHRFLFHMGPTYKWRRRPSCTFTPFKLLNGNHASFHLITLPETNIAPKNDGFQ